MLHEHAVFTQGRLEKYYFFKISLGCTEKRGWQMSIVAAVTARCDPYKIRRDP